MTRIEVTLASGSSDVLVGEGLLASLPEVLSGEGLATPVAVVSDTTVGPLYGQDAARRLGVDGCLELSDGEVHKRWPAVESICHRWLADGVHRRHSVLAVGGGVVTDVVGFAAAVYQRGIQWVAAPTTLLAMVDASVGGKTGVNLSVGKNLVGAFWPPRLVVADVATLATLPERELRAGLAEVVKTAWIGDHALLERAAPALADPAAAGAALWTEIVARCAAVKGRVVMDDEREAGGRKALNLGHTLGHALEAVTDYRRFLHGEAVAWGLLAVAELAHRRRLLSDDGRGRLVRAVRDLGPVPPIADLDREAILDRIGLDKKVDDGGVAWVLPTDDGVLLDQRLDPAEVERMVADLQTGASGTLVGP